MLQKINRLTVPFAFALTLFCAVCPIVRASFRQSLNYNEGWNIYNAIRVGQDGLLYPAQFTWTPNNYPMLSFVVMSALHRVTGDYLFTGRAVAQLSTLMLSLLAGVLLVQLGATKRAALLGGLFCFLLFTVDTASQYASAAYTNADDPQMFGLAMVGFALVLYVKSKVTDSSKLLLASALVVALAISLKHSSIDIVVAMLIDCGWNSWKRLAIFLAYLLLLAALSVWLQTYFGGPWFLRQLLEGRVLEGSRAVDTFLALFLPVCLPALCAIAFAVWRLRTRKHGLMLILILVTLASGFYFGSAQGVSVNCFFSLMVALSLSLGLLFSHSDRPVRTGRRYALIPLIPLTCFLLMLIPGYLNDGLNPVAAWRGSRAAQEVLDKQVQFIVARPGPALCEYLLTCYLAGKPYVYDPFNATRLIRLHRLDAGVLSSSIERQEYSSVGILKADLELAEQDRSERFTQSAVAALERRYHVGLRAGEVLLFIPNSAQPDNRQ